MRVSPSRGVARGLLAGLAVLAATGCATAQRGRVSLEPFHSDGCSLFPDGRPEQPGLWCDCCLRHDLAYWRGGTGAERLAADLALRECVLERTGNPVVAEVIYLGARVGGGPAFPTWYRWGYGWPYGRGELPLDRYEESAVEGELAAYRLRNPELRCNERGEPISRALPGRALEPQPRRRTSWVRGSPPPAPAHPSGPEDLTWQTSGRWRRWPSRPGWRG